jgi:parvulin-like peptidyl-prolyl isomerase
MVRGRMREYADLTGAAREEKEKKIYKEELRELIGRELIVFELFTQMKKNKQEGKIDEIKKYVGTEAERDIADRKKRQGLSGLSEAEFVAMLQQQGLSYKALKRQLEQETLSRIYIESMVKDKIKYISLNDLWDYYQAHPKDFAVQDRVKWLDLFVSFRNFSTAEQAKAHATAAWKSAMAGSDFVELVKKMGQGDSNLRDGEGIGQKHGEIQPSELEPVLMDMAANQVSPLLQTSTGYHIVKVTEREKAGTLPFDEKVQALIRAKLGVVVQEKERQRIVEDLWRRYRPKVVDPG